MDLNNLTSGEPEKEKTGCEMNENHEIIKKSLDHNVLIQPLLTDLYQITMAYSYWKSGKINDIAVFDVNFRRNPFSGEFTIFAGLEDCLKFLQNFHYTTEDIDYLRKILPDNIEEEFYQFIAKLDARDVILYAIKEGNVVFPKIPLIRLEGPLIVLQLIETTILNLVNYASLVTTNAARFRMAAGDRIKLYEFGLRRAQGPDGGLSASKYSYMGGCDGTSNVLAGKLFGIPVKGTHAHSYVTSFKSLKEIISTNQLTPKNNKNPPKDFFQMACDWRDKLIPLFKVVKTEVNEGEFAAFISFAQAFPDNFMALVDTFDVLKSGLVNFCAVALTLYDFGYQPIGIRIDSGDLAYLSRMSRGLFKNIANKFHLPEFEKLIIMASNDINEETILSLNEQQHSIDTFGIGTHLVTCQKQPALGCVYKLVELNNDPRMKLTQDIEKITIPGKKNVYRLYGDQYALVDIMQRPMEEPPLINKKVLCRHPFLETKRAYVVPVRVENLLELYWNKGELVKQQYPTLEERRTIIKNSLNYLRPDIKRTLNPTPYKVAVTDELYNYLHDLWLINAPIGELF